MRGLGSVGIACFAVSTRMLGCHAASGGRAHEAGPTAVVETTVQIAEVIYDGGLKSDWQDAGKASRELIANQPAKVRFDGDGEWILSKAGGLSGDYGGVAFRMQAPVEEGDFLEVRVDPTGGGALRPVKVSPSHRTDLDGGWKSIVVPMDQLNPGGLPLEQIVFRTFRPFATAWILFDKISLIKAGPPSTRPRALPVGKRASMRISCDAKATKISRFIYGVAGYNASQMPADLGATIHRWGGNGTSRYNWETYVGNLASDWFFENHASSDYALFLADNLAHGASSALTVPILGWVAKDATSYAFPVSVFGPQAKMDPEHPDIGNGTTASGAKIPPGPPTRTSVPAPPDWLMRWVGAITAKDAQTGKRSVSEYILDNEPMLWNTTHRDVRPEPLGYDELLDRTIRYGAAIRKADPGAVIAGPAEWGWPNYFFSAKDSAAGFRWKPDRRAHGDVPLIDWYLGKLREYEGKSGVRILDVLDLHYYPQANKVYSEQSDPATAALRLRSTRSLWDPSYVDESWINDAVRLLPRMKEWVQKNYPGRGISIGEWNFGGEKDITGALATAEALGRFAQFGVTSAFYWTAPPAGSPSAQGFLAYRNFDGKGGHFLDWYLPTTAAEGTSLFASRDEEGKHVVAVAINMSADDARAAAIDVGTCGAVVARRVYVYGPGASGFAARDAVEGGGPTLDQALPPRSITVIDFELAQPLGKDLER